MKRHLITTALFFMQAVLACAQKGAPLPPEVDLVPEFEKHGLTPEVQGGRDVCSLFAVTSLADYETARHAGPEHQRLSPEYLIWAARRSTGKKGEQSMFYEAVHGLNTLGICSQQLLPYSQKDHPEFTPSKPEIADAQKLEHCWHVHWIRRWDVSHPMPEAELHAIKAALAAHHPVACGLRWPKKGKDSKLLDVPAPDQVEDGHSISFVGYKDDPKISGGGAFRVRNSWGTKWGEGGYGLMSYAYVQAYGNDALWLELEKPGAETPIERIEAENAQVISKKACETQPQDMKQFGRMWSGGRQLFCNAQDGGHVQLGFEVNQAGRYRVRLLGTVAPDFGKVRFVLDGTPPGHPADLYCGRVSPSGTLEIGTHDLAAGRHTLDVHVVGKNVAASGFSFGLDAIDLLPPKE